MFGKKANKPQNRIDSLIGAGTIIEGDLNFSGGMRIDGRVNGDVIATQGKPSTLVLSELAQVNGNVTVTHLVVNGVINGSVSANEYLELQSKARITGDVSYHTIEMHLGAVVDGRLLHAVAAVESDKVVALKIGKAE
ncbi:MAG: polymer-forming cytoskeletal protein [Gallionella sp.]